MSEDTYYIKPNALATSDTTPTPLAAILTIDLANSALSPDWDAEIVLTIASPNFEMCSMKINLLTYKIITALK